MKTSSRKRGGIDNQSRPDALWDNMKTSPRNGLAFRKRSRRLARSKPRELSLPLTWPEVLKLMMLLAALWAIMLGVFFVIFKLGGILGA